MSLVNLRNEDDWEHEEKEGMSQGEVTGKESELSDLAEEFSARL